MTKSSFRLFAWLSLPLGLYAFAIAWYLSDSPYSRSDFPLDDAWIHQVYARSFSNGEGFAYNTGHQEAGSTSPLWVIATAPAHWLKAILGGSIAWYVKLIGFVLGAICLLLVFDITRLLTDSIPIASLASTLLAIEPSFLFSVLSGMETILVVALWIAGATALARRSPLISSFLFGLLPTARPEALVVIPFYITLMLFYTQSEVSKRRTAQIILLLVPSVLWVLFCLAVNGHPLPNTYYVKSHDLTFNLYRLHYLWQVFTESGFGPAALHIYGLLCLILFLLLSGRVQQSALWMIVLLLAPCAYAMGVISTREMLRADSYIWTRWLDPPFLIIIAAASVGFANTFRRQSYLNVQASTAALAVSILLLLGCGATFFDSLVQSKERLSSDSRVMHFTCVAAGEAVNRYVPSNDTVAVMDAGASRFFGERTTIDLVGLNATDICMKKVSRTDKLFSTKWLFLPPDYFSEIGLLTKIHDHYDPVAQFTAPSQGGNVTNWHTERIMFTLYRRNADTRSDGSQSH